MFGSFLEYSHGQKFRQIAFENYCIDHIDQNSNILFVTFDSMLTGHRAELSLRYPWAGKHLIEKGYSLLAVKTDLSSWYRDDTLHETIKSDCIKNILKKHERVIFYGDSMGGYAALAFSSIHPNAEILCYAPQSTLSYNLAPWENRFHEWTQPKQNWTGEFIDASQELTKAKKAYIVYDPFCEKDRLHVLRLPQNKVVHLKAPFLDHKAAKHISKLDLLKPIIEHVIDGTIENWFPKAIQARKKHNIYMSMLHFHLIKRAINTHKNLDLAIKHAEKSLQFDIKNEQSLQIAKMLLQKKTQGFVDIDEIEI